jgi:protein-disulfide isomerase
MKNKIFIIASVAIALGLFAVVSMQSNNSAETTQTQSATSVQSMVDPAMFVRPHSPTYGPMMAKVQVVEWFDPECESCRAFHPVFKKIKESYQDQVHFVLRYMPYHKNSMYAASVLEEARELGKFDQALDLMYETQPEWADHHNPKPELVPKILAKLGIPADKLDPNTVIKKHGHKIDQDQKDGEQVGVRGTPSFFVNGQYVRELGDAPLRASIEAALKQ